MTISDPLESFHNFIAQFTHLGTLFALNNLTLTPINYQEEKDKFFASSTYNPQFEYSGTQPNITEQEILRLFDQVEKLHLPPDLHKYIYTCVEDMYVYYQARIHVGTPKFPYYASQLIKLPQIQPSSIRMPLSTRINANSKILNATKIQAIFRRTLDDYGITKFKVVQDNRSPDIIRVSKTRITIGTDVQRNVLDVRRLILHEIESHLFQKLNRIGRNKILNFVTYRDGQCFAEGLALYNEISNDLLTPTSRDNYRYRYKVSRIRHKSFRDIYSYLRDHHLKPDQAFNIVFRLKRGMSDTSQPGGFCKDALYIIGYQKTKTYLESGGTILDLYAYSCPRLAKLCKLHNLYTPKGVYLPHIYLPHSATHRQIITA